ncbi:MAG: molybdenum cofactor guanylyltransferase [Chloroflexota bacterium]
MTTPRGPRSVPRAAGTTAIVLAGGRSTRFGGPKLALEIEGRSLLEHAIGAAAEVVEAVIVAGSSVPDRFPGGAGDLPIRSVTDDEAFAGPLAGLSGALRVTATGLAIVVGGDMPGLVPDVLRAMIDRLAADDAIDAVVLASPLDASAEPAGEPARRQALPLAIDVARGTAASMEAVASGDRSLVRLLDRLRVMEIPASEWLPLDPAGRTLFDVDRPADVARIRHELRRTPFSGPR